MVDGRRKGNGFEVEVAYLFADWLCPVDGGWYSRELPPPFRRRPADKDNMPTDWVGGRDIIHNPDVYFPFGVEAKKYAGWSIDTLFLKPTKQQLGWWSQCVVQADALRLPPLLVLGRNHMEPICVMLAGHLDALVGEDRGGQEIRTYLGDRAVSIISLVTLTRMPPLWLNRLIGYTSGSKHAGGFRLKPSYPVC